MTTNPRKKNNKNSRKPCEIFNSHTNQSEKRPTLPLDFGKFRLLCSRNCAEQKGYIFDYKPHNSNNLVGKHRGSFLAPSVIAKKHEKYTLQRSPWMTF